MGLLDMMFGTDVPAGFYRMDVLFGFWNGFTMPVGLEAIITLAPDSHPDSAVAFREFNGPRIGQHILARDIDSIEAISGGRAFFGFGADGAIAAGIAAAIDQKLAPWELRVAGPPGEFHLRAWGGIGSPLPGRMTWSRVEERIARSRHRVDAVVKNESLFDEPDDDPPPEQQQLEEFILAAVPLAPFVDDEDRLDSMWDDPDGCEGIERVEADLRCYSTVGTAALTEDEQSCLLVMLTLFSKGPLESFEPSNLASADAYYVSLGRGLLTTYGTEVCLGAATALNAAFMDYLLRDQVACATVNLMARHLLGAMTES